MTKKKRILIIEDEPEDRLMFETKFTLAGYEVIGAATANEGWEMIIRQRPDLVLLDLVLPDRVSRSGETAASDIEYSGLQLLEEIKHDPDVAGIPVIILTNLGRETFEARAKQLGASDYLVKSDVLPKDVVERAKKAMNHP